MLASKEEIKIQQAVVHILDSALACRSYPIRCWTVVRIFPIF